MAVLDMPKNSVIHLTVDVGYGIQAALGVGFDEVSVYYSKNGDDFELKTLAIEDWSELGNGYYTLRWNALDMDTLGEFSFRVVCPYANEDYFEKFDVVPAPFGVDAQAPICVVTGNLIDIGGDPSSNCQVIFRPQYVPGVAGYSLISSEIIRTYPDAFGNFAVKLLRSAQVLVEIEKAGIKYLITVPDAPSATLIDLLPPFPA